MPKKKYLVTLTEAEREELEQLLRAGKHSSRKLTCARILLKAAAGCTGQQIAGALGVGRVTVERLRERFVERGLDAINDGRWHTVSCTRYPDGVTLTVDGAKVAGRWGRTGTIANSWPLSIGGKTVCDQRSVGCDYYAGELASVRIDASDSW